MRINKYTIFVLIFGMVSAIPLPLVMGTLKLALTEEGIDIQKIGLFAMVSLPYSFKYLWSPLMDSLKIPFFKKFGKRKSWMILMQIMLAISIAILGIFIEKQNLVMTAIFAMAVSIFSASQDIVIDAYRIESLKKDMQGIGASMAIYGYRIGLLISGAGALLIASKVGWDVVYFWMASLVIFASIVTFFIPEIPKEIENAKRKFKISEWSEEYILRPFTDIMRKERWYLLLLFILFFKFGDAFASSLVNPFLYQMGFTKVEIATIAKTFGLAASLMGIFTGGVMIKKIGILRSLYFSILLQMGANSLFVLQSQMGYDIEFFYIVTFFDNFCGGIGDVSIVAFLSILCNQKFTATQYSLLSSLGAISRTTVTSSAGFIVKSFGWENFFIFSVFLTIPALIILFFIKNSIANENARD